MNICPPLLFFFFFFTLGIARTKIESVSFLRNSKRHKSFTNMKQICWLAFWCKAQVLKNKHKKGFCKVLNQERSNTLQRNTSVSINHVTGKCTAKSDNSELHNSQPYFLETKHCEITRYHFNLMMMTIRNSVLKNNEICTCINTSTQIPQHYSHVNHLHQSQQQQ